MTITEEGSEETERDGSDEERRQADAFDGLERLLFITHGAGGMICD